MTRQRPGRSSRTIFVVLLAIYVTLPGILQAQWATSGNNIYNTNSGNVGIGTASPSVPLMVQVNDNNWLKTLLLYNPNTGANAQAGIQMTQDSNTGYLFQQGVVYWLWNAANGPMFFVTNGTTKMIVTEDGNVGIGTTTYPSAKLDVNGNVNVSGNISAKYQDIAEWVPAQKPILPGTVVIQDSENANQVIPSTEAYDTRVAGVVSPNPGLILGEAGDGKVKVATTGRVKVRVDATHGSVRLGDLLVTSDKEGVAMKSEPLEIGGRKIHQPGTLIGKALEALNEGEGEILVLLSLQ